jgi:hypothetical protein
MASYVRDQEATSPKARRCHPTQTARVSALAIGVATGQAKGIGTDQAVLDRIRKCLAKANHPRAQEDEAQTAIRMASRLTQQFYVTNADLIEKTTDADDLALLGGQSTVSIVRTADDNK